MKYVVGLLLMFVSHLAFAQIYITGEINDKNQDIPTILFWNNFKLTTDTIVLDNKNNFRKEYHIPRPMLIKITGQVGSPFMIISLL